MRVKSLISMLVLLLMSLGVSAQSASLAIYEVKAGETLYSISKRYGLTVDGLNALNPSLGAKLLVGQKINVPIASSVVETLVETEKVGDCRLMYKVKRKETAYSICKKFDITVDEFFAANPNLEFKGENLKRKQMVCIPYAKNKVVVSPIEVENKSVVVHEDVNAVKVAFLLPFNLSRKGLTSTNLKMIDFYEGFLLAVQEMKAVGCSTDVYAYDETPFDSVSISKVLAKPELKSADLIVGPYEALHLGEMITFANQNDVNLLVPFSAKDSYVRMSDEVFMLNAPQPKFYAKVYESFLRHYSECNIVFLHTNERGDNEAYYAGFKTALDARGIAYEVTDVNSLGDIMTKLQPGKKNVIVSVSASESAYKRMVRSLDEVVGLEAMSLSVFGLPNWLQFADVNKESFLKYNCVFFSKFLYDETDVRIQDFTRKFDRWFHRSQYISFPMYGIMGYDLGMYFLTGFHRKGEVFFDKPSGLKQESLQTPLRFVRDNNYEGHYNNQLLFVGFDMNGNYHKTIY